MVTHLVGRLAVVGAAAALTAAIAACSFDGSGRAVPEGDGGGGGGPIDAGGGITGRIDASPIDAVDLCSGWTLISVLDSCEVPAAYRRDTLTLAAGLYTYNTDDGTLLRQTGGEVENHSLVLDGAYRVVSAESIDIQAGAELRIIGDLPVLMVAWDGFTVAGTIDSSSHPSSGGGRGAGGDAASCLDGSVAPSNGDADATGGGGGGGGGFGSAGGEAGDGASDTAGDAGERAPGPTRLRGGCAGGLGGVGVSGGGAAAGSGGGAVALAARGALSVDGLIHAGGSGGAGAGLTTLGGGGGGGSGGLIWLSGATITLSRSTVLAANGGAGGEGSDGEAVGDSGDDAPEGGTGAIGGDTTGNTGGNGGNGSNDGSDGVGGGDGTSSSGGGGGGGGAGLIDLDSDQIEMGGAFITPPPR
ncbi:MAG TPA: hypothetical protein VK698_05440 [Kofleriaceae bacterium]|nr:hypothetical protein [Kofleriaceae bacterium]